MLLATSLKPKRSGFDVDENLDFQDHISSLNAQMSINFFVQVKYRELI